VSRRLTVVGITLALWAGVIVLFFIVVSASLSGPDGSGVAFGPRVAVVELEGMIIDVEDLLRELKTHRENPQIKAVVIRINSPGGVVGPSQELHDALLRLRKAGKPVVASLGAVAASGGYYVAVGADQIYANPGTLTGSIGVIMQMANVESLMKKVGVDYVVVKAGRYKDLGNFSRPMSVEERRVLQALLDDVHAQFIEAVATGRRMEESQVRQFADGRVFSGVQAVRLKMVDELGGLEDAIDRAARLAGLEAPPRVVSPRRRFSVFDLLRNQLGLEMGRAMPGLPVFKTPLYLMD
jgi:protease IV